jgi:Trypsin-like peptidase domain
VRGGEGKGGGAATVQDMVSRVDVAPIDAQRDVLPLFAVDMASEKVEAFLGTGFLIGDLIVTCWHCVSTAVAQGVTVVAAAHDADGYSPCEIRNLARDANGADLAVGAVDLLPSIGFELLRDDAPRLGADVWTYGYPLTQPPNERARSWMLEGRFLQGYLTRHFYFSDARIPAYELDMRAPAGLSGAPVVEIPSRRVAGVAYGVNEVAQIEHMSSVHPETGERIPEVQRLETFALALDSDTLRRLTAPATGGLRLDDYLDARARQIDADLRDLFGGPQPA